MLNILYIQFNCRVIYYISNVIHGCPSQGFVQWCLMPSHIGNCQYISWRWDIQIMFNLKYSWRKKIYNWKYFFVNFALKNISAGRLEKNYMVDKSPFSSCQSLGKMCVTFILYATFCRVFQFTKLLFFTTGLLIN